MVVDVFSALVHCVLYDMFGVARALSLVNVARDWSALREEGCFGALSDIFAQYCLCSFHI